MEVARTTDPASGVAVVALTGPLDTQTRAALDTVLAELLARGNPRLVVDLAGLTSCDSAGLSALLLAHQKCVERGGYLRLAGPSDLLLRILRLVGLLGVVPVFDDVPAALAG